MLLPEGESSDLYLDGFMKGLEVLHQRRGSEAAFGNDFWQSDDRRVLMGHAQLNIRDHLNTLGHLADDEKILAYAGEIYGRILNLEDDDLAKRQVLSVEELIDMSFQVTGGNFQSKRDTNLFFHYLSTIKYSALFTEEFLGSLIGKFAFAAYDKKKQEMHFGRDRLGQEGMYHYFDGKILLSSSDPFAIAATGLLKTPAGHYNEIDFFRSFDSKVSDQVYGDFSGKDLSGSPGFDEKRYLSSLKEFATFIGITPQQPGTIHRVSLNTGFLSRKEYSFAHPMGQKLIEKERKGEGKNIKQLTQDFKYWMKQVTSVMLDTDYQRGIALSGVDSVIVAALLSELCEEKGLPKPIAYTVVPGWDSKRQKDKKNAELFADAFGLEHKLIELSKADIINSIPDVINLIGTHEPSMVENSILQYQMMSYIKEQNEKIRLPTKQIRALFTGDMSDEIFGGYRPFRELSTNGENKALQPLMPGLFDRQCIRYVEGAPETVLMRAVRISLSNDIEVRLPFAELAEYGLRIPPEFKMPAIQYYYGDKLGNTIPKKYLNPKGNPLGKYALRLIGVDYVKETLAARKKSLGEQSKAGLDLDRAYKKIEKQLTDALMGYPKLPGNLGSGISDVIAEACGLEEEWEKYQIDPQKYIAESEVIKYYKERDIIIPKEFLKTDLKNKGEFYMWAKGNLLFYPIVDQIVNKKMDPSEFNMYDHPFIKQEFKEEHLKPT
ncbi:asparagine synthase-related protein [Nanoarchaeota archaeon]